MVDVHAVNQSVDFAGLCAAVAAVLARDYARSGTLTPLVGDVDDNLRLEADGCRFVVKLLPPTATAATLAPVLAALQVVAEQAPPVPVPRLVRTLAGADHAVVPTAAGPRLLWMSTWLDGDLLAHAGPAPATLRRELGATLAQLDRALTTLPPPPVPTTWWDLQHAARIGEHLQAIEPPALREQVRRAHHHFVTTLAARLAPLRRGVIHGDANDHNVLVRREAGGAPRIAGLIDFGDLCHSVLVGEVAIAATYLAMAADDPLQAIDDVVAGYDDVLPLTDAELALVVPLIVTRCAVSITNAAVQQRRRPGDAYTQVSQQGARRLLALLLDRCPVLARRRLQLACGRPSAALPLPTNVAATLPFDLTTAPQLDLGFAATTAGDDPLTFDADLAAARIAGTIGTAPVAIGRYLEPRPLYTGPAFGDDAPTARRRTVHLGVDLFAPAGTPVAAAIAGAVHHVTTCADPLDYGGLVVLRHQRPDGTTFGSLYGHLDPASLATLRVGQPIAAGERFARLGDRAVNGGWPPHLHLQLLAHDPLELPAVPPGVADPDDLPAHAALYPDPAPWLGLAAGSVTHRPADPALLRASREQHFAGNLRTSYREPLALVRGSRHFLFDPQGRRFLDAYNNVPHVGHGHPHVVRRVYEQSTLLATNTRYLHDGMARYAERLAGLLPTGLDVFFFTASGSEANELALRLARQHTGAEHFVVMDHGYHGHTTGAMAVSPYKFRQRGAPPQPDWVHVAPLPDVYRGPHRGADAGCRYAADTARVIDALLANGRHLAGYLGECLPSVGGQLELPDGFLASVYATVRAAGGLCIADDVQTALWRTGEHAFGFQRHAVVPDVLVLGKPLGNGFPLGAVVTTRAIADSFADGPEFFSTFGGSTVAMAAGLAVLDVLAAEPLAANARRTGDLLLAGLRELQQRHATIGDVRGRGLFLGVDLVSDRDRRTPAGRAAAYVKERLRQRRVLIGTDGPHDNVLKIRPPMTFDGAAAATLLDELDRVLREPDACG